MVGELLDRVRGAVKKLSRAVTTLALAHVPKGAAFEPLDRN